MAERLVGHGQTIGRTAERQMRKWALGLQVEEQLRREPVVESAPQVHPWLAISREAGAGGSKIAARLGERLGWQVLDRQLIDYMAEKYQLPSDMLEFVDEKTSNWLIEILGKWLSRQVVTQVEYIQHVGRIVLLAAHNANTIVVGRGAQFLLPRDKGLSVRIIAPRKRRIERVREVHSFSESEAAKYVDDNNRGRGDFVKKHFHRDVADPHLYDTVINTERFAVDEAVDLLIHLVRTRFEDYAG